jgi:hypothetical protein
MEILKNDLRLNDIKILIGVTEPGWTWALCRRFGRILEIIPLKTDRQNALFSTTMPPGDGAEQKNSWKKFRCAWRADE